MDSEPIARKDIIMAFLVTPPSGNRLSLSCKGHVFEHLGAAMLTTLVLQVIKYTPAKKSKSNEAHGQFVNTEFARVKMGLDYAAVQEQRNAKGTCSA